MIDNAGFQAITDRLLKLRNSSIDVRLALLQEHPEFDPRIDARVQFLAKLEATFGSAALDLMAMVRHFQHPEWWATHASGVPPEGAMLWILYCYDMHTKVGYFLILFSVFESSFGCCIEPSSRTPAQQHHSSGWPRSS